MNNVGCIELRQSRFYGRRKEDNVRPCFDIYWFYVTLMRCFIEDNHENYGLQRGKRWHVGVTYRLTAYSLFIGH